MSMGSVNDSRIEPAAMESLEPRLLLAALPLTVAGYSGMSGLAESINLPLDTIPNNIVDVGTLVPVPGFIDPDVLDQVYHIPAPAPTVPEGWVRTGVKTDLVIDGGGMFIVEGAERLYTRNGRFNLDVDNYIVTADGKYLMGYAVDAEFNLIEGELSALQVPLNDLVVARQTSWVEMDGRLGGDNVQIATLGTILQSDPMVDLTGMGGEVTAYSRLVDLVWYRSGRRMFFEGTILSFEGLRGEGRLQGLRQMDVDANTTVQHLMEFVVDGFGINLDPAITPPGTLPAGAAIVEDPLGGTWAIRIIGNVGQGNAIRMGAGGLWSTSATVPRALMFQTMQSAAGTSTFTSFLIFDSLGNSHKIDMTFVLESQDNTGRTWRFFANSLDDTDPSSVLGAGTIHFDPNGNYTGSTGTQLRLDLDGQGVRTVLPFGMDLSRIGGIARDGESWVMFKRQDGEPPGTLTDSTIDPCGKIVGMFSNGSTRVLGQIVLAAAPDGWFREIGDGLYRAAYPSVPMPLAPPHSSPGQILSGYYEDLDYQSPAPDDLAGMIYTGTGTDLAVSGDGMFIVDGTERLYTRNGRFQLDGNYNLVTTDGMDVMGCGVDAEFNLIEGELSPLQIPLYDLVAMRPTSLVEMVGQLGGDDLELATWGTILQSSVLIDTLGLGGQVTSTSRLVDLERRDHTQTGGATGQVFFDGTTLSFEGHRGYRLQGLRRLDVDADTTVQDLMDFMVDAFGINTDPSITPAGATQAGPAVVGTDMDNDGVDDHWSLAITGNVGTDSAIQVGRGGVRSDSVEVSSPLTFHTIQEAVGSSTYTTFSIYDSLGDRHEVDMTFVLESEDNTGRMWRFFANSLDDTDPSSVLGSGTIHFAPDGTFAGSTGTDLQLDLNGRGVQTPLAFSLDLSRIGGIVEDHQSRVQMQRQDGEPPGTLMDFTIAPDGMIVGLFDNGYTRVLGQVALAVAPNGWLHPVGDGLYRARHPRKGIPMTTPQAGGAGEILQGYYEEPGPQRTKPGRGRWHRTDQASLPLKMQWRRGRPQRGARRPALAVDLLDALDIAALRI